MLSRRGIAERGWLVLVMVAASLTAGCATYDERVQPIHQDFYGRRPQLAVEKLQDQLEGADADRLPLLLELGSALAADGRFVEASEAFMEADEAFEQLDYTSSAAADVTSFAVLPESGDYRASPAERVMVNTQNMLNFLALGDADAAAIEARKIETFLTRNGIDEDERFANDLAWGLAGFVFELVGDVRADDCWMEVPYSPLRPPASIAELPPDERGVILVVVQRGKAPIRRQSSYLLPWDGRLHRLILPALVNRSTRISSSNVSLDGGTRRELPQVYDYAADLIEQYDQELPMLIAAAAVQAGLRALTAEAMRAAAQGDGGEDYGDLIATVFEWILSAFTSADTRGWTLLPAEIDAMRLDVTPGEHQVTVHFGGYTFDQPVTVEAGSFALVNVLASTYEGYEPLPPPRGERNLAGDPLGVAALEALSSGLQVYSLVSD